MSLVATCRLGNDLEVFDYRDDGFINCDLDTDSDEQERLRLVDYKDSWVL